MEYNLYISAKKEIVNKLKNLFNRYFEQGVSYEELKKWFVKKKNFKNILQDINNVGYQYFHSDTGYENFVKDLIYEVLNDLIAKYKDDLKKENNNMIKESFAKCPNCGFRVEFKPQIGDNMTCPNCNQAIHSNFILEVKKFDEFDVNDFKVINEMNIPDIKIEDLVDSVPFAKPIHKNVLTTLYKIPNDYIDLISKKSHKYKINDMRGDILGNARVTFDAYIYGKEDINKIKENIVYYYITEFLNSLPDMLNIFDIDISPISFVNKEKLKSTFSSIIIDEKVINIITEILGFDYIISNEYYVWNNQKNIGKKLNI